MDATGDKEIAKKVTRHLSDCVIIYNEIPEKTMKQTSQILTSSEKSVETTKMNEEEVTTTAPKQRRMNVDIDRQNNKIRISFILDYAFDF